VTVAASLTSGVHHPVGGQVDPARLHTAMVVVGAVLTGLVLVGSLVDGSSGSIAYVASLGMTALVILLVAMQHQRQARAWRLVGIGITVWAATGFILTAKIDAEWTEIPDLVISLGYTIGYLPVLVGLTELTDPQVKVRRWSGLLDGVLIFLVLYGVLWLLVVEMYAFDSSLPRLDRAFSALYPAGDLAIVMLVARIFVGRAARRRVALLLAAGAILCALADTLLLTLYLIDPWGAFPITDLLYLTGLACYAGAAMWSLLPPPPVAAEHHGSSRLPLVITTAAVVPALVLLGVVSFSDRQVQPVPVAVWLAALVLVLVLRATAGVRALERAHQQALWLASHDLATGALLRPAFLHEVSEGSLRERSGTVILLEVQGIGVLADAAGLDAADAVLETTAARLRAAVGGDALFARLTHDRFAAFMRASDFGRGRQVVAALEKLLAEPVTAGGSVLHPVVCGGVAQADGAVIDVLAGVRRATVALQQARLTGASRVLFDADVTGRAEPVTTQPQARSARLPVG